MRPSTMLNPVPESGNSFNLLRLFAAFLVLYGHGHDLNKEPLNTVLSHVLGVYIFFAISGYLIATSWAKDPHLLRYFWRRSLRIFPGLIVVTLLTVFVLGPLLTTASLSQYYMHPGTYQYLENILLLIHFELPGVFTTNPFSRGVNGSLWSLPIEFALYISVAAVGLVLPAGRFSSTLMLIACLTVSFLYEQQQLSSMSIYGFQLQQFFVMGFFFWAGAAIYHWQLSRYFNLNTFGVVLIVVIFAQQWPVLAALSLYLSVPFLVLCFGSVSSGKLDFFNRADYSYGLYIYAFPVQQTLTYLFPQWPLWLSISCCLVVTLCFAALSWHLVEKPMLRFKPKRAIKKPSDAKDVNVNTSDVTAA